MYALNLDTGQAIWESPDERPDAWTSQFLGANPRGARWRTISATPIQVSSPAPTVALAARTYGFSTQQPRRVADPHDARDRTGRANIIVLEAGSEVVGVAIDGKPVPNRPVERQRRLDLDAQLLEPAQRGDSTSPSRSGHRGRTGHRSGIDARPAGDPRAWSTRIARRRRCRSPEPRLDRTGLLDGGDQVLQFHGAVG